VQKAVRKETPPAEEDTPMPESPQSPNQLVVEEPSTPQAKVSPVAKKKTQTPSALHQVYSQVRLEEKGKASKQLSNKELREKKLRGLMDALKGDIIDSKLLTSTENDNDNCNNDELKLKN
jgi:hypothetical protein